MSDLAIRAENLGKQYRIGAGQTAYRTLRETLGETFAAPFRFLRNSRSATRNSQSESIWALKDVAFDIKPGEVVGIIGRNGAGKSTLLKVLSRITEPTEGSVQLHGRVSSLLEVGTGFHPELTGRENIYLNGAILGMRRNEIDRKFDEIVAFAEIEKFIDTPVKRYSSGMYVRLGFGVAAHLETEILMVDEVLAVGDAAFQKKCLGKMSDVAHRGRTVLLVSHNMASIRQLCPRCIWLDHGQVKEYGDAPSVVDSYLSTAYAVRGGALTFDEDLRKESQVRGVRLLTETGTVTQTFNCDERVIVELTYQVHKPVAGLHGLLQISKFDGTAVLESRSYDVDPNPLENLPAGTHVVRIPIPARTLAAGEYVASFNAIQGKVGKRLIDDCGIICRFSLDDVRTYRGNRRVGYFSTVLQWDVGRRVGADRESPPYETIGPNVSEDA